MKRKVHPKILVPDEHWCDDCKALWHAVVPSRANTVPRLALVRVGIDARHRAEQCRHEVDAAGMTSKTETTGALHVHPLLKIEKDARAQFARVWAQLGLDWNCQIDGTRFEVTEEPEVPEEEDDDDEGT